MIYLFDTELSENTSIFFAITSILGIGKSKSNLICNKLGFSKNYKLKNISKEQLVKLINTIESSGILITGDLKKVKSQNLKNLFSIKSYRGLRLKQGLPVRGQRTHTNARTVRKRKY